MTAMTKHVLWIAALVAACEAPDTLLRVAVTGGASTIDSYELRLGSDAAQDDALPVLDVAIPDGMAGETNTLELWGLATGTQVAYGTATVKPALHETVDVAIELAAIQCGQWCIEGGVECMGSGTATCMEGSDGCLAWSAPSACPSDAPVCSDGVCGSGAPVACSTDGASCNDNDPCTQNDTCEDGVCTGKPLCVAAPANATPTCSNGICGFACGSGYTDTGSDCLATSTVFVTSTASTGNLGGLAGADASCQKLATAAGLAGTYKAWLSDSTTEPAMRLTQGNAYALVDGTIVAGSWAQLISGVLAHPIDLDERGSAVSTTEVWTDTNEDGTATYDLGNALEDCDEWTNGSASDSDDSTDDLAFGGLASSADYNWTSTDGNFECNTTGRLYCFQQ
jgi:hypothetical protein